MEAPQRSGVEVRTGSKTVANVCVGFLETWEIRSLLPHKRPEGIPVEQHPGTARQGSLPSVSRKEDTKIGKPEKVSPSDRERRREGLSEVLAPS